MASSMSSVVVWRLSRCAVVCGVVFIACCSLTTTALASISLPLSSTISSTLLRRLCRCSRCSGSRSQGSRSSSPWGACWRRSLRNQSLAGQMHLPPTLQRRLDSPPAPLTLPSRGATLCGCCWVQLLGVAVSRAGCSNSSTQMSLAHPSTSVALSVVVVVIVAATVDAVAAVVVVAAVDTARLDSCYTFVTCVVSPRSMAMLLLTASVWIPRRCLP